MTESGRAIQAHGCDFGDGREAERELTQWSVSRKDAFHDCLVVLTLASQRICHSMQSMTDFLNPPQTAPIVGGPLARTVLDTLPDAILITDTVGVVLYVNHTAVRLLGVAAASACGQPIHEILELHDGATDQPIVAPLSFLLSLSGADTAAFGSYTHLVRRDTTKIPIDCSISTIHASRHWPAQLVLTLRDASHTRAHNERLLEAVRRDELTKLWRRGELERRLARLMKDGGDGHVFMFMDLDGFKGVNDHAGHAVGDAVLREVAALFSTQVRERDTLARLGGDEFGLLLEHCPLELARKRAQDLHTALANHTFKSGAQNFALGVSIGIAALRHGRHNVREVIAAADAACYAAKRQADAAPRIRETILE